MVFKQVWQCGHCGIVHNYKVEAKECCQGSEELSFQCSECNILFNIDIKDKCPECGK